MYDAWESRKVEDRGVVAVLEGRPEARNGNPRDPITRSDRVLHDVPPLSALISPVRHSFCVKNGTYDNAQAPD